MLPVNFKNESFPVSDISYFSLIDKQTQTSICVSEQGSSVINIHPGATEQEVTKSLDYCKILNQTRILDTKVHKENIKEYKQEVACAKSSQGKFLCGNIFQQENRIEPQSVRPLAWKLDESLDKESINSGYIYIPSADAKYNQENVPNSARLQNKPSVASKNNEEDKGKLIKQPSSYSKISKEKISPSIGFTSIPIEKVNINATDSETQMADKKASNEDIGASGTGLTAERLNYMAQEIKRRLSSTLSVIMTPICAGACRQQRLIEEVNAKRKEEEERKIIEGVKPDLPAGQANSGLLSSIRKSWSNLVCGTCPSCQARQASQVNSVYQVVHQQPPSTPPPAEVDPPDLQCEPPPKEEKEAKQPCSPNKFCGPVITYPCPPPKPRDCGFEKESTQSLVFKSISPLVNEMSPNNEFFSEDYIFNNNDHPSLTHKNHLSADRNEHIVDISKPIVDVSDLSAVASSIKDDDYIHSKPENLSMIQDNTIDEGQIQSDHRCPIAKIMDVVESTVVSLKEHIDLDRISYIKNETESQKKAEESKEPSSEYFIRAVAPEPMTQSHQFVPPRRSLFTSFKSTIFKFFGDRENMEEPVDISSSSESSSGMSDDSSNDESN